VSGRARDNLRIAAKVLAIFAVLLGMLFVVRTVALSVRPEVAAGDPFSRRPSAPEVIANTAYAVFLFLTFLVPLLVLRGELRRRKRKH
jgi:hypothetical protein